MTLVEILRGHGHSLREAEELVEAAYRESAERADLLAYVREIEDDAGFAPSAWSRLG